jgi:hypothetical protein
VPRLEAASRQLFLTASSRLGLAAQCLGLGLGLDESASVLLAEAVRGSACFGQVIFGTSLKLFNHHKWWRTNILHFN